MVQLHIIKDVHLESKAAQRATRQRLTRVTARSFVAESHQLHFSIHDHRTLHNSTSLLTQPILEILHRKHEASLGIVLLEPECFRNRVVKVARPGFHDVDLQIHQERLSQ